MKTFTTIKRAALGLGTIALISSGLATRAHAAALQGQLMVRPLTPQEVKDYSLTGHSDRERFEHGCHRPTRLP